MRYASALAAGPPAALLTPRPTKSQVEAARIHWRRGMGEVLACRLPNADIVRTGLAGAVELATMSAIAEGGDGQPDRKLLAGYAKELVEQAFSPDPRPAASRCALVARWSAQVRKDGQRAIGQAITRGFVPLL